MTTPFLLAVWLGLCSGLGLCSASHHVTHHTYGSGGVTCEGNSTKCLRAASCAGGQCQCRAGYQGIGHFDCWPSTSHNCHIINDPLLHTMNGESVKVPATCRFLVTHVKTAYNSWYKNSCEMQVHAFQNKDKGKVFVHGVDIALKIDYPELPPGHGEISIRKYGNCTDGVYEFMELGQLTYTPDGPFMPSEQQLATHMPNVTLTMVHDPYDNKAIFDVKHCGIQVTFRPADPSLGNSQVMTPGLSVTVDPAFSPEFPSLDKAMCFQPGDAHQLKTMASQLGLTNQQAALYKTLTSGVVQNQPDAAEQCSVVPNHIMDCPLPRLSEAMTTCQFFLTKPKVIRCLDETTNGNVILEHYGKCVKAICHNSRSMCEAVQLDVSHCSNVPEVGNFVAPETCEHYQI